MVDRTVIIIAHRLSTVKDADVIAVFGKGSIIDAGRHEDLLRTSKTYANLVRKQLSSAHAMNFSATLTGEVLDEVGSMSDGEELELSLGQSLAPREESLLDVVGEGLDGSNEKSLYQEK